MTVLRGLRVLVLGETWTLPLGLRAVLGTGVLLREAVPGLWHEAGGLVLLLGVVAVLTASVRSATRARDEGRR